MTEELIAKNVRCHPWGYRSCQRRPEAHSLKFRHIVCRHAKFASVKNAVSDLARSRRNARAVDKCGVFSAGGG